MPATPTQPYHALSNPTAGARAFFSQAEALNIGSMPGPSSDSTAVAANTEHGSPKNASPPSIDRPRQSPIQRSGGFLLEPAGINSVTAKPKRRSYGDSSPKGKRREATRHHAHRASGSAYGPVDKGRSPLSQEQDSDYTLGSSTLQPSVRDKRPTSSQLATLGDSALQGNGAPERLDSDSTDIVNLALSLNESRRRGYQFGGAYDINSKNEPLDTASQLLPNSLFPLAPDLDRRGVSELSGNNNGPHVRLLELDQAQDHARQQLRSLDEIPNRGDALIPIRRDGPNNSAVIPSEATMQRVQRTKSALQLSYQYRRLLNFLPELPDPNANQKRPPTGKVILHDAGEFGRAGRSYNPLQYIRNRRARFREGCPLNPETEGWNNIDKVEEWVNVVAEHQELSRANSRALTSLPKFPVSGKDYSVMFDDLAPKSFGDATVSQTSKPPRPRSDWETDPWSMLADAYWTSNPENFRILEDRHGTKLYPLRQPDPTHRVAGGSIDLGSRSIQPVLDHPRISIDDQHQRSDGTGVADGKRGRQVERAKEDLSREATCSSSSDRRAKWPKKMLRSPSISSSDESIRSGLPRARMHRPMGSKDLQEMALLERQLRDFQARQPALTEEPRTPVSDHAPDERSATRFDASEKRGSPNVRERNLAQGTFNVDTPQSPILKSHDVVTYENRHFDEFDSTAPNSPERRPTVPNITINLTPPQHTGSSPQKRATFPQRSILAEVEKSLHMEPKSESTGHRHSKREDSRQPDSHRGSFQLVRDLTQPASPTRGSKSGHQRNVHSIDKISKGHGESGSYDSRFRGLLRGAKIAELVASPVTRVSDLIWRREEAESGNESSSSYESFHEPMKNPLGSQQPSRSNSQESLQSLVSAEGYYMKNLPIFRSPFAANHPSTPVTGGNGNISQLELSQSKPTNEPDAHGGRPSPAFSATRPPTDSPSDLTRQGDLLDENRHSSSGIRRFAVVDSFADSEGQQDDSFKKRQPEPARSTHQRWASLDHSRGLLDFDLYAPDVKVTLGRVARLRLLQFSCAIRAHEISRRASLVKREPSHETQGTQKETDVPAEVYQSAVSGLEGDLHTANLLAQSIDHSFANTRESANTFSTVMVNNLHDRLQALHSQIADDLTQMARSAESGADELSTRLATECTLDVKRLNETIDLVMRRRRRRMRWLRRAGFAVLEWMVLASMWGVWLVVVLVLLVRGLFRGAVSVVRWLLWL